MATLFSRHSLVLQTSFSEIKRSAREQPVVAIGSPGSVGVREVKGREFYYRQFYDARGRKTASYVGPVGDPDAEARAGALRQGIEAAKAIAREVRILAAQGYVRVDGRTAAILGALANRGIFRGGAILVGSHAYGALLNDIGIRAAAFFTEEVDIARGAVLAIAADSRFEDILAESTVPLRAVPGLGRADPSTSYKAVGSDRLRVDLLVPGPASGVTTRAVPELKAHAEGLPYLGYLLEDSIEGVVLGRDSALAVRVPRPERFAWHKMFVAQERSTTSEKRTKDILQAAVLFAALVEDAPDALEEALGALPRGARSKAIAGAKAVIVRLDATGQPRAAETLRQLVGS